MRRNPGLLRIFRFYLPESASVPLPGYEILYHLQFCLFSSSLGHRPRQSAFRAVTRQNRFHAVLLLFSLQNYDGSKISPTEAEQMRSAHTSPLCKEITPQNRRNDTVLSETASSALPVRQFSAASLCSCRTPMLC